MSLEYDPSNDPALRAEIANFDDAPPPSDTTDYGQHDDASRGHRLNGHAPLARPRITVEDDAPMRLAEGFIDCAYRDPATPLLRRFMDQWWVGRGGWRIFPDEHLKARVRAFLDVVNVPARDRKGRITEGEYRPLRVTTATVNECAGALIRLDRTSYSTIIEAEAQPAWLDGRTKPPATQVIAFSDGLLDVPAWVKGQTVFEPATPAWFGANVLPFPFHPEPAPPAEWLAFLSSCWPDSPGSVEMLQEWIGYAMSSDTAQQKMLLLVGPPRAGKGTIARVMTRVVGLGNVASPTLAAIGTNFGIWPLLGKSLAIIGDARLSGRTDQSIVTERLLSITGEDAITFDRKNLPPVTARLNSRIVIITNELPRLSDSSGALASRFLILRLNQSHLGKEDTGLSDRLFEEAPAIARWALEGLRRLRQRGKFVEPGESNALRDELADLSSPVSAFVRECCIIEPGPQTPCADLFTAWRVWCEGNNSATGSLQMFGRDLRAAFPNMETRNVRVGDHGERVRVYPGIRLTLAASQSVAVERNKGANHG